MGRTFENILLVSGSGRNVGKTTFIREIISQELVKCITTVKISPHFHKPTPGLIPITSGKNWELSLETNSKTGKDTSLFLNAGADKSYYIQAKKSALREVLTVLEGILPNDKPVIIESAGIREALIPGMYVVVTSPEDNIKKEIKEELMKADLIVISDKKRFYPDPRYLQFKNRWIINTSK